MLQTSQNTESIHENGISVSFNDSSSGEEPLSPIGRPVSLGEEYILNITQSSDGSDESVVFGGQKRRGLLDTTVQSERYSRTHLELSLELDPTHRCVPTVKAFIDDYNLIETVKTDGAVSHFTEFRAKYAVHSNQSEKVFKEVKRRASDIGMVVNNEKTQLLCISHGGDNMKTYVRTEENERIESGTSLKILGFYYGEKPDVSLNTHMMTRKFSSDLWSMRFLKRAGMQADDLREMYSVLLRPTIEYAAVTYHSLLTAEQNENVERMQCKCGQ